MSIPPKPGDSFVGLSQARSAGWNAILDGDFQQGALNDIIIKLVFAIKKPATIGGLWGNLVGRYGEIGNVK